MTTPSEYTAAFNAARAIARADVNNDVPQFFRSYITDAEINKIADDIAKAAVDAAAAVRRQAVKS